MNQESTLIRQSLKTPRAAAIAGIAFSLLAVSSNLLVHTSIPVNPLGSAMEVVAHSKTISLALNLVPFAGIAFLWFIAVLRDRLGELEDRFFATVFLGSGLLYIAMFFVAAALAGGLIRVLSGGALDMTLSDAYAIGRAEIYQVMNIYAIKMAGVFMISTSAISLRTRVFPLWMGVLGFALALLLLLSAGTLEWAPMVFPLWVFLISAYILIERLLGKSDADSDLPFAVR